MSNKTLFVALFTSLIASASAQQTQALTKTDYLKKSNHQKTTGIVLAVSGTVLATIGLTMTLSNLTGLLDPNDPPRHNSNTADILGYSGLAIAAASIPFFIASSKNKKKAFSVSLKNNVMPGIINEKISYRSVPAVSISIGF